MELLCVLDGRAKSELEFWKANIHHLNGHSMWFASSAVRVACHVIFGPPKYSFPRNEYFKILCEINYPP